LTNEHVYAETPLSVISRFRLMVTWLTMVLRPVGPYPILVLSCEQASAKNTLVKVLRLLIDPHTCITFNPPHERAQP
jgi:hypothetical protein